MRENYTIMYVIFCLTSKSGLNYLHAYYEMCFFNIFIIKTFNLVSFYDCYILSNSLDTCSVPTFSEVSISRNVSSLEAKESVIN